MNFASYKTTICSVISAGASFVLFSSQLHMIVYPQWAVAVAMFASIGGLAALGIVAKDYNATGGTVPVTTEAAVRVEKDEAAGGGKL